MNQDKEEKEEKRKKKGRDGNGTFREVARYAGVMLVSVLLTYSFLFFVQISRVSGHSMDPTFHDGEIVLVNRRFYQLKDVSYGDVVIAEAESGGNVKEQIIKRVIGKPGDTLEYRDGEMYRNGQRISEPYIKEEMKGNSWKTEVGKGELFLMGDNRNSSADSRTFGAFSFSRSIIGKVFAGF